MKKFLNHLCSAIIIPFLLLSLGSSSINAKSEKSISNVEELIFKQEFTSSELAIDNQNGENYYIQDFKKIIKLPTSSRSVANENKYKLIAGREILNENEYKERENELLKSRGAMTDKFDDGRGTHLYIEIEYTMIPIGSGESEFSLDYFYCNSSGSTLTEYYVVYSQYGVRADNRTATTKQARENISTLYKSLEKNVASLNWPSIIISSDVFRIAGVNQFYNCRGYKNNWSISF